MVFYRKYRPQTIEDLDSEEVREKLYASLSAKDVSHAFLFTGPKGLGKTSTARIVAKVVNCERLVNQRLASSSKEKKLNAKPYTLDASPEPCNKCHQCVSITNGTNIDVLEIDGASNRGIDEIRDLREKVRLSAARSAKKVYIIDEVHMLTTEAFNALLKTLEEPPPHVIFILCTTEPHKLPQTIVSRCFHVSFKRAGIEELVRSFKRIAKKETLNIDDEALSLLATLSDGSFRDGAKILEEMTAFDKKITKELVEEKYQILNIKNQIEKIIEALSKRDIKEGLVLVGELVEDGVDMKYFLEQLINTLHGFLLHKVGVESKEEFSIFNFQFSIEETKELVVLLSRAYADLKYAVLPQLPLELAIVEWGEMKRDSVGMGAEVAHTRGSPRQFDDSSNLVLPQSQNLARAKLSKIGSEEKLFKSSSHAEAPNTTAIENFWQELIKIVKSYNHSIAAVLRGCELKEYDGKNVIIETKYKFHKDRLDDSKARKIIEKVCKEISGKTIEVSVVLK